jgi:hypothetical protein
VIGWFELFVTAFAIALLLYSGYWTDKTFQGFDKIPAHYDWRGNATRLTGRRGMAWGLPVSFSIILLGLAALFTALPPERINGDPRAGLWLIILTLLIAQGAVLMLLKRWAAAQR